MKTMMLYVGVLLAGTLLSGCCAKVRVLGVSFGILEKLCCDCR